MYKDKQKQREAVQLAVQRYRAKQRESNVIPQDVIPSDVIPKQPKPKPQSYNPMMIGYVRPK